MLPHILPFISLIFATPIYSIPLTPRQPTPEPFTYLNLTASDIHTSPSSLPSDRCAVLFSDGYLVFPNAVLNATDPNLNTLHCQKELLFNLVPSRLQFSILAAKFDGQLSLEGGYFVEEVGMSVHYVQRPLSGLPVTDVGTSTLPYGKQGEAYNGVFNITMNVLPPRDANGRPNRPNRGASSCVGQPRIVLDVWVKLGHVEQKTDDVLPGLGVVKGVRVAFAATEWKVCGLIGWPRD